MEASEAPKTPKHRSPSYPAINLEAALERAQQLEAATGRHPAPVEAVMSTWGYGPKSSGGLLAIAALKKFGLVEDEGKRDARTVRLTPLGRELLVYGSNRDSDEWLSRARKAVLAPAIHRELWEKYEGSLPSDSVILPSLRIDRGFSESAARELLKEFRATIAFARLSEAGGIVSENGADNDAETDENDDSDEIMSPEVIQEQEQKKPLMPGATGERKPRTIQVTYSPTEWALVQGSFPMSEADWQSFLGVLQSMKPGLVVPESDE